MKRAALGLGVLLIVGSCAACHTGHPVVVTSQPGPSLAPPWLRAHTGAAVYWDCENYPDRPLVWYREDIVKNPAKHHRTEAHEEDHRRVMMEMGRCEDSLTLYEEFGLEIEASAYCAAVRHRHEVEGQPYLVALAWEGTSFARWYGLSIIRAGAMIEENCDWSAPEGWRPRGTG